MNYTIQKKYSLLLACDEDIDIYYDSTTRNLYSNSKKEFFTYTTKILFALARLGNQGVSPRGLVCAWCCVKDCDCTVHEKTDLYSIFFKPDVYQNYELWVPLPEFNYSRHVFDNTQRWSPFIKRWFNLSDRVMEKVDLYSTENDFDPNKTIGVFYKGADKRFEVRLSDYQKYRWVIKSLLKKNPINRIFVLTDDKEFRDYLIAEFGSKCFYFHEVPACKDYHALQFIEDKELQVDPVEYGVRMLAAIYLISRCKTLINSTGDMALWITFYRGHTKEIYQFDDRAVCWDPQGRIFSNSFFTRVYRGVYIRFKKFFKPFIRIQSAEQNNLAIKDVDRIFYPSNGRYPRAHAQDNYGRFREIIMDPLNLLIERVPEAGYVEGDKVTLHNGVKVTFAGPQAYYDGFSSIFIFNRGVHEPLEEFVFQSLMTKLPDDAVMIELGAYWGHYSMWLKKIKPAAQVILVEPDASNLQVGRSNFINNGLEGEFIQSFVGHGHFGIDEFFEKRNIRRLHLLHSDIQGHELEMLDGAKTALESDLVDYIFISTHTQNLHEEVIDRLGKYNYRVEVASGYDGETTSFDGLVFASSKRLEPVFEDFKPMGRLEILKSNKDARVRYLNEVLAQVQQP